MSERDSIQAKVDAIKLGGLPSGPHGDPRKRLAERMNTADPEEVLTVRFKYKRKDLEELDYHASACRYSRSGLIKLAIKTLLDGIAAHLDPVDAPEPEGAEE